MKYYKNYSYYYLNINRYSDLQDEGDSEGEGEDGAEWSEEELDGLEYVEIF